MLSVALAMRGTTRRPFICTQSMPRTFGSLNGGDVAGLHHHHVAVRHDPGADRIKREARQAEGAAAGAGRMLESSAQVGNAAAAAGMWFA